MIELIGFVLTVGAMLLSEFLMTTTPKQRLDRMYCRVAGGVFRAWLYEDGRGHQNLSGGQTGGTGRPGRTERRGF